MKKLFSITTLMLVILVGVTMIGCGNRNGKISEFCYETVIVQLTVAASDAATLAGHTFTPADFPEVALSEVRLLGGSAPTPPGMSKFLALTLENPGRDNVLKAVYELNKRGDVYLASLSYVAYDT